jgi:ArsR family transcriptional regulator
MSDARRSLDRSLHAVADPTRRRILQALAERDGCSIERPVGLCGSDIEMRVQVSQSTVSHHMAILCRAGLVEATKVGPWVWYRRNESALRQFLQSLRAHL